MQSKRITESNIYDVAARAKPREIAAMLKYAVSGDFEKARNELDSLLIRLGMSAEDILTQSYTESKNLAINETTKLEIVAEIGECNFRVVQGANERIQLEAMLAKLALLGKGDKLVL